MLNSEDFFANTTDFLFSTMVGEDPYDGILPGDVYPRDHYVDREGCIVAWEDHV